MRIDLTDRKPIESVKYQVPMLKVPRVESNHILIGPSGKDKSSYLGVKTLENVFKMFVICF